MGIANDVLNEYGDEYDPAWRTSDSTLAALEAVVDKYEVDSVVEFGPGLSTIVLIRSMIEPGEGYFYLGIDHIGEWAIKHQDLLERAELGRDLAPTFICPLGPDEWYQFQPGLLSSRMQTLPRLVFIDGPGSSLARGCKRAMDAYREIIADYTIVVVDDTHRPMEKAVAQKIASRCATEVIEVPDPNFNRTTTIIIPAMLHQ